MICQSYTKYIAEDSIYQPPTKKASRPRLNHWSLVLLEFFTVSLHNAGNGFKLRPQDFETHLVCWYSAGNRFWGEKHPTPIRNLDWCEISSTWHFFTQNLPGSPPKLPTKQPPKRRQKTHLCFVATQRAPIPRSLYNSLPGRGGPWMPSLESTRIPGFICVSNDSKVAETPKQLGHCSWAKTRNRRLKKSTAPSKNDVKNGSKPPLVSMFSMFFSHHLDVACRKRSKATSRSKGRCEDTASASTCTSQNVCWNIWGFDSMIPTDKKILGDYSHLSHLVLLSCLLQGIQNSYCGWCTEIRRTPPGMFLFPVGWNYQLNDQPETAGFLN